jgi:hypothetical protein
VTVEELPELSRPNRRFEIEYLGEFPGPNGATSARVHHRGVRSAWLSEEIWKARKQG